VAWTMPAQVYRRDNGTGSMIRHATRPVRIEALPGYHHPELVQPGGTGQVMSSVGMVSHMGPQLRQRQGYQSLGSPRPAPTARNFTCEEPSTVGLAARLADRGRGPRAIKQLVVATAGEPGR